MPAAKQQQPGLRRADLKSTERYESGEDYIVFKTGLTHGQRMRLGEMTQNRFAAEAAALSGAVDARLEFRSHLVEANSYLFECLCESWSFSKEPTVNEYLDLDEQSGDWVDECINDVMEKRAERMLGKANGSVKRNGRRDSEPSASESESPKTTAESS